MFYIHTDALDKTATLTAVDQDGNLLRELYLPARYSGLSLKISADDQFIAVLEDRKATIYTSDNFQRVGQLLSATRSINFSWSPAGHRALILTNKRMLVWSPEAGILLDLPVDLRVVSWSPDGRSLALVTREGEDGTAQANRVSVYVLDGSIARSLFYTPSTSIHIGSYDRPSLLWLDRHTLALWQPKPDGSFALAHYDLDTDQYETVIEGISEPGIFLPDRKHAVYRVVNGEHYRLQLASVTDGNPVTLADSFGALTSRTFTQIKWSPDFTGFVITVEDDFNKTDAAVWSRNNGTQHGTLPHIDFRWFSAASFAYIGTAANGVFAGVVNIHQGVQTNALEGASQVSFISVEQSRNYNRYVAFYWQNAGGNPAFDIYGADVTRLYRLPADLDMTPLAGPFLQPILYLSPDGRTVIPRGALSEPRLQIFTDGQLVREYPDGSPEDVLWFPDSSKFLILSDVKYDSEIWQLDRTGTIERRLTTPYLSHGSHMYYGLKWCWIGGA